MPIKCSTCEQTVPLGDLLSHLEEHEIGENVSRDFDSVVLAYHEEEPETAGPVIVLKKLVQTCSACPSQWTGQDAEGRIYYFRYRWGSLSVRRSLLAGWPWNEEGCLPDKFFDNSEHLGTWSPPESNGFDGVLSEQAMLLLTGMWYQP